MSKSNQMQSCKSIEYERLLPSPLPLQLEVKSMERRRTDQEFLSDKKKEDNYQDQLLIELIPLLRKFNFLPKGVINSSFNKVLDHIYTQQKKKKEEN